MQLPFGSVRHGAYFARFERAAVFSMGGYVAGPVMLAALVRKDCRWW